MELHWKSGKILLVLSTMGAHSYVDSLKNIQLGFFISQHHIPGTGSGHGNHKKLW
jgi:hypothetical protein